jgi:hypothetical protein
MAAQDGLSGIKEYGGPGTLFIYAGLMRGITLPLIFMGTMPSGVERVMALLPDNRYRLHSTASQELPSINWGCLILRPGI